MSIHLSNSLEALFQKLEIKVWEKKRTLFNLPLVAVASYGMKRWLKIEWAKKGLTLGIKVVTLEEALEGKVASRYDLLLALFHLLQEVGDDPEFDLVRNYLNHPKKEKRVLHLAKILSRNFYLYGIYGDQITGWQHTLFKRLKSAPYSLKFWKDELQKNPSGKEIHLFGFSYIPPLFLNFFRKSKSHLYLLSPCQTFWSDTPASPLLLSLGSLGREMAKQLDGLQTDNDYPLPLENFSMLQALKIDLLFNKDPLIASIEDFSEDDHSIEVHTAPSLRREIEMVYGRLLYLAEHDPTFDPAQVLVLAKDITPYVPYIRAIFEAEGSMFDPLLFDQPKGKGSDCYELFLDIIKFGKSRLEKHLYFKILREDAETRELIADWIDQGEILWGYDYEERNTLLKESGCKERYGENDGRGTWKKGFETLLNGLLLEKDPKVKDAEKLGQWIAQFEALYKDLNRLIYGNFDPIKWVEIVTEFIDTHVTGDEEDLVVLKQSIRQIIPGFTLKVSIPFDLVFSRIQDSMNQKENVLGDKRLHAVTFSSLFPNRALPKETVFFLGAQDKDFPKFEEENSLNLLAKKTFFPSMLQEDSYAFLESILSAKKYLFISYQQEKGPSPVVSELLDYLDSNFSIDGLKPSVKRVFHHPQDSFDPLYFTNSVPIAIQEEILYKAATSDLEAVDFLKEIERQPIAKEIDLKDLYQFAKDPLRTFYQMGLAFRLKDIEIKEEGLESFAIDPLGKYGMASLLKSGQKNEAYSKAKLPILSFGEIAKKEVTSIEEKLKYYGVPRVYFFQEGGQETRLSNLTIKAALHVNGATLFGKLEDVVEEGLLVGDSKDDFSSLIKAWPKLLLMGVIGLPTRLIFWKLGKIKEIEIRDPLTALQDYIEYYHESFSRPNFSHPQLAKAIIDKTYGEAKKNLNKEIESPYWKFLELKVSEENFLYAKKRLREIYKSCIP